VVEPRHFRGYNFFAEPGAEPAPVAYEPRVYPLGEVYPDASETARQIVALTERLPDADGKPIFDHYGVIVPGVAYPKKEPRFVLEDDTLRSFDTIEQAKKTLDLTLIRRECLRPIVVGERDGRCYFVSYF
jgi:hypothetical protein